VEAMDLGDLPFFADFSVLLGLLIIFHYIL
jgi:hypothetical protein